MRFLVAYSNVAMSFAAIDMVWLGIMAERLYRPALGEILGPEPNILPAVFSLSFLSRLGCLRSRFCQPAPNKAPFVL